MASTLKIDTVTTPDGTGNITFSRPITTASGAGAGKIVQVVHGSLNTQYTRPSMDDSYVSVGLSASITPTSSSNHVLVLIDTYVKAASNHNNVVVQIHRDSTAIGGARQVSAGDSYSYVTPHVLNWKDSPSSTSSLTYTLRGADLSDDGGTLYVNAGTIGSGETTCTSSIILMEVSA